MDAGAPIQEHQYKKFLIVFNKQNGPLDPSSFPAHYSLHAFISYATIKEGTWHYFCVAQGDDGFFIYDDLLLLNPVDGQVMKAKSGSRLRKVESEKHSDRITILIREATVQTMCHSTKTSTKTSIQKVCPYTFFEIPIRLEGERNEPNKTT